MRVLLLVELDVDQAEVDKLNEKRKRLGRAQTMGQDEAENVVAGALQHNFLFDNPNVRPLADVLQPNQWMHGCGQIYIDDDGKHLPCLLCAEQTQR